MTSIKLIVVGAKTRAEVSGVLTSGAVGIPVHIQYDSTWDCLTRDFVCTSGKWGPTGVPRTVLNVNDSATVAHEVMIEDNHLYLGVSGRNSDGTLVIQTTWADCGLIHPGADADASPSAKPTLPIWAQLQQQISDLKVNGTGGGYYKPEVSQPDEDTIQFAFVPSGEHLPDISPVSIHLPAVDGEKGEKGDTGTAGKSAYQYAKDNGYTGTETEFGIKLAKDIPTVTQEAGESETLVMSQKAVTDLVNDALGQDETIQYETVDSVDEMTDTAKSYVLSSTNTIWTYGEFTVETKAGNRFDPATATLNQRFGTSSLSAANGYFVTDYIAVNRFAEADPYIMRAFISEGVGFNNRTDNSRIHYFDENKNLLGNKYLRATATSTGQTEAYTDGNGNDYWHIDECQSANGDDGTPVEIPDFDHSTVAYVRVTLSANTASTEIGASDIADVVITFDADAVTASERKWYDTGLTPETAGNSGNYIDLLVKVNQNTSDIAEISGRVTAIETGSNHMTVPSFWEEAAEICISKIRELQVGKNCVTFPFFSDNHQRNGYAGMLIGKIMEACHIPFCFYGGDSIDSGYIASEDVMIAQDAAFDTSMAYIPEGRFCRAVGNHDGFWRVSDTESHTYTRDQVYDLFLREEAAAQNKHFGDDGTYYYVEDLASKVRFVVLNTNGGSVDETQLAWLRDAALKFSESGWAVVMISHQPISNHYHANISNAAAVREIVVNSGVEMIGWFSGHIHRDRMYNGAAVNTTDDTEGDAMGFTQVTITSDHTGIAYDDATKHTGANDDQSHAIDFVTINRGNRMVSLTRLGIGNDRFFSY